jgi:hypothetical protein
MMNQIEQIAYTERTPAQNDALLTHHNIVMNKQMIGHGLIGLGQNLKTIRDNKYYQLFGYESFGDYTEGEHNIKERQAYNYIKVIDEFGIDFLQSNANVDIGVTKYLQIATLDKSERAELLEDHTPEMIAGMSVKELEEIVKDYKIVKEQLTMFENAPPPIPAQAGISDADLKEIEKKAKKEALAKVKEETDKLRADKKAAEDKAKAADDILKSKEEQIKNAEAVEERAKKAEADAKKLQEQLDAKDADIAAKEKQIKMSANPALTKFKFMFEGLQTEVIAIQKVLSEMDDETKIKCSAAVKKVMEVLKI